MEDKRPIEAPTTLAIDEVDESTVLAVRHGTATLDADQRAEVLRRLRAGEPVTVTVEARVFKQTAKPNRKFVRFLDNDLEKFAASFVGRPFLRDHEQGSIEARGGTIVESSLHGSEIRQTLNLVKPWAVEAALDGTLDRFSIGWLPTKPVKCSVCGKSMFDYRAGCTHMPGDEAEVDGVKQTVEMVFERPEGVETSAVNVPAVNGTGIDQIRAALSAARGTHSAPGDGGRKKPSMDPKILESLGLAADASEADTIAALAKLTAENESRKVALEAAGKRVVELEAKQAKLDADAKQRDVDTLVESARRDGKIILAHGVEGKPTEGKQEKAIRLLAAQSIDAAREWVAGLDRVIPGGPAQSAGADPTPAKKNPADVLDDTEKKYARQAGITDESFLAAKKARAEKGAK